MAYEQKYGDLSRLVQMTKNYLFYPSSGLFSCPLAMTDGAAKTLQVNLYQKMCLLLFQYNFMQRSVDWRMTAILSATSFREIQIYFGLLVSG